jgi:hypothetical protein
MQRTPGLTAADFDARVKIEGSLSFSGMAGCFSSCFSPTLDGGAAREDDEKGHCPCHIAPQ